MNKLLFKVMRFLHLCYKVSTATLQFKQIEYDFILFFFCIVLILQVVGEAEAPEFTQNH